MGRNSIYWEKKQANAEKALMHTCKMETEYKDEIQKCIESTIIYDDINITPTNVDKHDKIMNINLVSFDSVSSALCASEKVCVLNFASFKNPGGMFMKGSSAQEECLCHESFLYNVLKELPDFYEYNKKNLNKALYMNRALYSPNVLFVRDPDIVKNVDVLTCAAPNYAAAAEYCKVDKDTNSKVLRDRIRFVLSIIKEQKVNSVILGAYGCGVFGQDPEEVITIFLEEINNLFSTNDITKFIFAVIDPDSSNYQAFKRVIDTYKIRKEF